eukprot:8031405-Lingulodinium_polyedra.AAC.1
MPGTPHLPNCAGNLAGLGRALPRLRLASSLSRCNAASRKRPGREHARGRGGHCEAAARRLAPHSPL